MKRSLTISGHSTSVFIETEFWEVLQNIACDKGMSVPSLIAQIDTLNRGDQKSINLSSQIRIYVLKYYQAKTTI